MASYDNKVLSKSYWDGNGKYQEQSDKFYDELVPSSGKCSTVEGEMTRAISKLYYDYYNNGMINNTSGAAKFLNAKIADVNFKPLTDVIGYLGEIYNQSNTGGYTLENLEVQLEAVADAVVEYIASKGGIYTPNSEDMFDYSDDDCCDFECDYYSDDEIDY